MKKLGLLTLLLAAAVVVLAVKLATSSGGSTDAGEVAKDSIAMENIMTRVSVRKYQNKPVEAEKIEKMLRAAMAAPSAVNKQPWHFVVVDNPDVLAQLGQAAGAPLAIVVCGDMNKALEGQGRDLWIQDASAATENLLLAAHALGLGAVWTGAYPDPQRSGNIAKAINAPDNIVPLCTVVIGYPDETPEVKNKWNVENISFNVFGGKEGAPIGLAAAPKQEKTFKEIDVEKEFRQNPFQTLREGWLLCAGDKAKSNAMTIGWGAFGTLWRQPALTVYVAQKRYTHDFMEQAKYFTVMQFAGEGKDKVLEYMGHNSGRDGDKAQALGLTTAYTENGTPYYAEADVVIECEVMYDAPFQESGFKNEVPRETYANFDAGIHSQYIGRVVKAWKKQ